MSPKRRLLSWHWICQTILTPCALEPLDQGQDQSVHLVDSFISTSPHLKLSSDPEVMATGEEQVGGEATVWLMEEASLSLDTGQDAPASTSGSGLFLRGDRKITLGQGNFLDDLEEFKALPQKR